MSEARMARLADRGIVRVTGSDSTKLMQGLVTNDLDGLRDGQARFAGLLSPQGKILFDFLVVRQGSGYLLDVDRSKAGELVKRLTMYKLRADVAIADASASYDVHAVWGPEPGAPVEAPAISFADPRRPALGRRSLVPSEGASDRLPARNAETSCSAYDALRVEAGVPEGGKDYEFGDTYPHEADFDLLNGLSFTKGCYVGQEIVARMQNKTVVRKRVVKVSGSEPLVTGADVLLGEVPIGRIGTVDGRSGLAMLRLDRAVEAQEKGLALTAGQVVVTPEARWLDGYRASATARASTVNSP
jgi:tRNA-modifying protein YgfZ